MNLENRNTNNNNFELSDEDKIYEREFLEIGFDDAKRLAHVKEFNQLKLQLHKLSQELDTIKEAKILAESQLQGASNSLNVQQEKISNLESDNIGLDIYIDYLKKDISKKNTEVEEIKNQNYGLNIYADYLVEDNSKKDKKIEDLENKNYSLNTYIDYLVEGNSKKDKKIEDLENKVDENLTPSKRRERINELISQEKMEQKQEKIAKWEKRLDKLKKIGLAVGVVTATSTITAGFVKTPEATATTITAAGIVYTGIKTKPYVQALFKTVNEKNVKPTLANIKEEAKTLTEKKGKEIGNFRAAVSIINKGLKTSILKLTAKEKLKNKPELANDPWHSLAWRATSLAGRKIQMSIAKKYGPVDETEVNEAKSWRATFYKNLEQVKNGEKATETEQTKHQKLKPVEKEEEGFNR